MPQPREVGSAVLASHPEMLVSLRWGGPAAGEEEPQLVRVGAGGKRAIQAGGLSPLAERRGFTCLAG